MPGVGDGLDVAKPKMFKIHGCWVWLCPHDPDHATPVHSGRFTSAWRDPWSVCLASAMEHSAVHHSPVDEDL